MTLVEREISSFKFIILGEEYLKKIRRGKIDDNFHSEFRGFLDKYKGEANFEDVTIKDMYQKLLKELKTEERKEFY